MVDIIIMICKLGGLAAVVLIGATLLAIALGKIKV